MHKFLSAFGKATLIFLPVFAFMGCHAVLLSLLPIDRSWWIDPSLGGFFGGFLIFVGSVVLWLFTIFAYTKNPPKNFRYKEELLLVFEIFGPAYVLVWIAGSWLDISIKVFKFILDEPRDIGKLLVLGPLVVFAYEFTRHRHRLKSLKQRNVIGQKELLPAYGKKRLLKYRFFSILQLVLILIGWLVGLYGMAEGIYAIELESHELLILLIAWTVFTLGGVPLLGIWEKWAQKNGIIPWDSGYKINLKDLLKD